MEKHPELAQLVSRLLACGSCCILPAASSAASMAAHAFAALPCMPSLLLVLFSCSPLPTCGGTTPSCWTMAWWRCAAIACVWLVVLVGIASLESLAAVPARDMHVLLGHVLCPLLLSRMLPDKYIMLAARCYHRTHSASAALTVQLRAGNVLGDALEGEEPFDAIHVGAGAHLVLCAGCCTSAN